MPSSLSRLCLNILYATEVLSGRATVQRFFSSNPFLNPRHNKLRKKSFTLWIIMKQKIDFYPFNQQNKSWLGNGTKYSGQPSYKCLPLFDNIRRKMLNVTTWVYSKFSVFEIGTGSENNTKQIILVKNCGTKIAKSVKSTRSVCIKKTFHKLIKKILQDLRKFHHHDGLVKHRKLNDTDCTNRSQKMSTIALHKIKWLDFVDKMSK